MTFKIVHTNINVLNLNRSIKFYKEALNLSIYKSYDNPEGRFKLVYLSDESNLYQIELTWLRDRKDPYNHGDNDVHIAFVTDDFAAAHEKHMNMGCVCYENKDMGIYFIKDPDGYWLEIIPSVKKERQ